MGIQNLQKARMFSVAQGHSMAPIPRWSSGIIPVDHDAKVNHHHFLVGFHFNFSIVNMGDYRLIGDSHIFKAGPYGISRIIRSSAASPAVARHRGKTPWWLPPTCENPRGTCTRSASVLPWHAARMSAGGWANSMQIVVNMGIYMVNGD